MHGGAGNRTVEPGIEGKSGTGALCLSGVRQELAGIGPLPGGSRSIYGGGTHGKGLRVVRGERVTGARNGVADSAPRPAAGIRGRRDLVRRAAPLPRGAGRAPPDHRDAHDSRSRWVTSCPSVILDTPGGNRPDHGRLLIHRLLTHRSRRPHYRGRLGVLRGVRRGDARARTGTVRAAAGRQGEGERGGGGGEDGRADPVRARVVRMLRFPRAVSGRGTRWSSPLLRGWPRP